MKQLFLLFTLLASPPFACGDGSCEPPPPPPPPVVTPNVTPQPDGDSDHTPYIRQYYAICTCDKFKVAWGFETLEFREQAARTQCMILREKKSCKQPD